MARERPWPWILLALATGGLGWWLGRATAPDADATETASLEREAPAPAQGPMLQGAPARSGRPPPRSPSEAEAAPASPQPPKVEPPTDGPRIVLPGLGGGTAEVDAVTQALRAASEEAVRGGLTAFKPVPETEEQRAEREAVEGVTQLMQSDPEAATQRLTDLFRSGRAEERRIAYRALAQARHPAHRALAQRAVNAAREGDEVEDLLRMLAKEKGRDWSPEQITGAPDTLRAGDLPTAWASKQPDMGEVWIEVDFPDAVAPERLRVHETLGPGCLARVLAQGDDGAWTVVWTGTPSVGEAPTWCEVALDYRGRTRSLRLIVDTSRSPGWNEIDAVELIGEGRRQWAHAARAGSSYSD